MNNYTVYEHVFPNGKRYIGITKQDPERRWAGGKGYKDCPKMQQAIAKYGWGSVLHNILYEGLTKAEAELEEIRLIKELQTIDNGYNIEHGGNTNGTHSQETRRKISEANRGKHHRSLSDEERRKLSMANAGELNSFYGHHHSDENRMKQSEFMRGNQFNKGNHHSHEFKRWKSEQMHDKYKGGGNPRCRVVLMITEEGAETAFFSLRNAAENAKVSPATLLTHIKKNKPLNGRLWRYAK